ncbi:hypothetical protein F5Y18DRAFT_420980 [Xylariaceae sp. FL1019]|nr:hypothetical protein F5Y18DRAFT_420980 [Xylariaceae sp. FL1019]
MEGIQLLALQFSPLATYLAKLAPPRRFIPHRPHSGNRRTLLQYLFPRSLRDRYRERLIGLQLDTIPYYKHGFQSRIYRFILERQRRRKEQSRLLDHARRLLWGRPAVRRGRHASTARATEKMTSMPGYGVGSGNYGADPGRERGARRKKLTAMASSVYRGATVAANEIRESYNQTRIGNPDSYEASKVTIPGSFPEVAIVTKGNEQMVLFPSYAKQHVKEKPRQFANPAGPPHTSSVGMNEQDYWRQEWARHEDEKAIVDVDVRGWLYNPHRGPMTRRNRVLLGLARQLSGIPVPRPSQAEGLSAHSQHEDERERQSIAREAREIERRGRAEELAAQQGGYSERPKDQDSEDEGDTRRHGSGASRSPGTAPPSPTMPARATTFGSSTQSDAELALANANLMARIGPFLTTPLVEVPITLFFYNDEQSQSRIVTTDDLGHFTARAALDFVPTHVRVLVNEDISCTEPVKVIEPRGISLISDIDDTIKRSNIALGAKEIFRNTFVRELKDLTVNGVREWYNELSNLGLYPVLATYFKLAGLPPGSLHLKRYTGMLQGIFEPVAERKKGTLEKIMTDFPQRKFLLVGDSGEADLEVYTELAVAYPKRIIGIFIRDVTTPEQAGYFDSAFDAGAQNKVSKTRNNRDGQKYRDSSRADSSLRPALPPRSKTTAQVEGPMTGNLIDLSDEPVPIHRTMKPPPKPTKPSALKSTSTIATPSSNGSAKKPLAPPPPPARRSAQNSSEKSLPLQPLSRVQSSTEQSPTPSPSSSSKPASNTNTPPAVPSRNGPPIPPPRRRGTPSSIKGADLDVDFEPLSRSNTNNTTITSNTVSGSPGEAPLNKKLELWRRRLERAQNTLGRQGVPLYTWRRGDDVIMEAVGIVKEEMQRMGIKK